MIRMTKTGLIALVHFNYFQFLDWKSSSYDFTAHLNFNLDSDNVGGTQTVTSRLSKDSPYTHQTTQ